MVAREGLLIGSDAAHPVAITIRIAKNDPSRAERKEGFMTGFAGRLS